MMADFPPVIPSLGVCYHNYAVSNIRPTFDRVRFEEMAAKSESESKGWWHLKDLKGNCSGFTLLHHTMVKAVAT
jgi:hypothetical protein